jgi:hypothetical protein
VKEHIPPALKKLTPLLPYSRRLALRALRRCDWRDRPVPEASAGVPTMLMDDELRLLEFLTEIYWRGKGLVVDAGAFLGGSTVALASGLRKNLARRGRAEAPFIHSYDLFRIEEWTRGLYFPEEAQAGDSTREAYERNVAPFAPLVQVHEGDITRSAAPVGRIEILFIDVAKQAAVGDWIAETLFPRLIPGRSIVVQQDYLYQKGTAWLQVVMEYYADEFEMLCDTWLNSVAFRLRKRFAPGRLRPRLVEHMPIAEQVALMDSAAARFPEWQADVLRAAKEDYLELLAGEEGKARGQRGSLSA